MIAVATWAQSLWAIPAFPGADGFGANALGGRGGAVYHVTNLTDNASTPAAGSLRGVLNQVASDEKNGLVTAATVVFDVGGTIQMADNIQIKAVSNVTLAGQTAPGPGISMTGYKFQVTSSSGTKPTDITSNIIVRYIADRRGNTINGSADDAIGVLGSSSDTNHNTHDVVLDHVSATWGMDENLSVTDSASNVTISNSFINEALESGHQFGSLIRPRYGASVSYIGNLYGNNRSRNPRPGSYNNSTLNFDFRNNTIYNWSDRAGYTGGASEITTETVNMNYQGNYLVAGPSTPTDFHQSTAYLVDTSNSSTSTGKDNLAIAVYQANNLVDNNRDLVFNGADTGWNAFIRYDGSATAAFNAATNPAVSTVEEASPFAWGVGTTALGATTALQQTIANAGTTPWNRFESDARVINDLKTNQGAILLTAPSNEYNDLLNQTQVTRAANFDVDQDGMADSWEVARGLNPALATDRNIVVTSAESASLAGYDWLEMYLNDLTLQANWAGGTSGSWDAILNWNGQLPNLQDSSANFPNLGAAGNIAVGSHEHVGQLSFDNPAGYTLTGAGDITMDILGHNGGGFATVTVFSGTQTIGVPLNLATATHFTVAAGSSLIVTGALNAAGKSINNDGAGTTQFANIRCGSLTISGGTVKIGPKLSPNSAAGASIVNSMSLSAGSLDLTDNALIVDYATLGTLLSDTRASLQAGRLATSLSAGGHALGYADNATLHRTLFAGQSVDTTSLLVAYTYAGDSNLDGVVNALDFNALASNFGATGKVWTQGDFNYDGVVNTLDFTALSANFGSTLGAAPIGALVPEPTAMELACVGIAIFMRRRRAQSKIGTNVAALSPWWERVTE